MKAESQSDTVQQREAKALEEIFADAEFRRLVEYETGTPVKVTVDWEERTVMIRGPKMGRVLQLDEILEATKARIQ